MASCASLSKNNFSRALSICLANVALFEEAGSSGVLISFFLTMPAHVEMQALSVFLRPCTSLAYMSVGVQCDDDEVLTLSHRSLLLPRSASS